LPIATLMASMILGENVGLLKWLGVIIILMGIALSEIWTRMRRIPSKSIQT
jgi:drug/metabolite transporter (DMT)-like permease